MYTIKFLKAELDSFVWPRNPSVELVDPKFIFYGPIEMTGCGEFKIKRIDFLKINNLYKQIKRNNK